MRRTITFTAYYDPADAFLDYADNEGERAWRDKLDPKLLNATEKWAANFLAKF